MNRLIYSAITSLDGYLNDAEGNFDWSAPDPEVHAAVNELLASVGTMLYGRRMYDVLRAWEAIPSDGSQPPAIRDFAARWQAADKIVYSRTMTDVATKRTRIERDFEPAAVRALKGMAPADLTVGGAHLAAEAIAAGLVDEYVQFVQPIIVGAGTHWLPAEIALRLELIDVRRFAGGTVQLSYRAR
jgi:dihydrofolate reductase